MMEYKITRINNNPDWAYAQGFEYALIEFKKNGKTIEIDDAHKKMLLEEIDPLKMGEIRGDAYFVAFPLKCFEDDEDYDEEEAESIIEDYYVTPAQNIYDMQVVVDLSVTFDNVSEVIEATVRPHGNGARVMIPKKHLGKNVKIVILNE